MLNNQLFEDDYNFEFKTPHSAANFNEAVGNPRELLSDANLAIRSIDAHGGGRDRGGHRTPFPRQNFEKLVGKNAIKPKIRDPNVAILSRKP
jgi:hypothetical protein